MSAPWQLRVYDRQVLVHTEDLVEPLELGRQDDGEEGPFSRRKNGPVWRLVVANRDERSISRIQALLEPRPGDRLKVSNLSTTLPLRLGTGKELKPRLPGQEPAWAEEPLPVSLTLGKKTVHIQQGDLDEGPVQSLAEVPALPLTMAGNFSRLPLLQTLTDATAESKELVRWLQATMGVFQSAASSSDFLSRAAQAVVEITGMDSARVLLLDEKNQWQTRALYAAPRSIPAQEARPVRTILWRVYREKRTFWQLPEVSKNPDDSWADVRAVVAAPILDRSGKVIGALYGDRRCIGVSQTEGPITELEAMLVELLASGIAAGLARLEQEQAALTAQVLLEQFFSPEVARQLTENPDLLKGKDCQVTVLFADICGFSRISERLGPSQTFDWISQVLQELSDCVRQQKGVLVDYIGDEIAVMWGAPEDQPDHARRACQAALAMQARLPALNERWQALIQEPLRLHIGINTGSARVGNAGSKHKPKYGPLGNTVNLGSRVQGVNKYLRTNLLLTGTTHAQLGSEFPRRRLCQVRVVNIAQPVDLYELAPVDDPNWAALQQGYEEALTLFEQREYARAARTLGNLLGNFPNDGPALVLLSRAVNAMLDRSKDIDSVWELPGK